MKKLKKQLEKKGYNVALSNDGIEVYDLIENDYIQIEIIENGNAMLSTENSEIQVDNNLSAIIEELTYFTN